MINAEAMTYGVKFTWRKKGMITGPCNDYKRVEATSHYTAIMAIYKMCKEKGITLFKRPESFKRP